MEEKIVGKREAPTMRGRGSQRELREEQARPSGVADRLVLLMKPGNAGGGKEPDFWRVTGRDQQSGDWLCLSTPLKTRRSRKELYLPAKMGCFRNHARCETEPSCAGERSQSESRVREIRTHGSMSGSVETEHGVASEAPADERAGNRYATPKPPRHLSTLPLVRQPAQGISEAA